MCVKRLSANHEEPHFIESAEGAPTLNLPPGFLGFLKNQCRGNRVLCDFLGVMIRQIISASSSGHVFQSILLVSGLPRNGKSNFIRLLEAFIQPDQLKLFNYAGQNNQFSMAKLLGCRLYSIPDVIDLSKSEKAVLQILAG